MQLAGRAIVGLRGGTCRGELAEHVSLPIDGNAGDEAVSFAFDAFEPELVLVVASALVLRVGRRAELAPAAVETIAADVVDVLGGWQAVTQAPAFPEPTV